MRVKTQVRSADELWSEDCTRLRKITPPINPEFITKEPNLDLLIPLTRLCEKQLREPDVLWQPDEKSLAIIAEQMHKEVAGVWGLTNWPCASVALISYEKYRVFLEELQDRERRVAPSTTCAITEDSPIYWEAKDILFIPSHRLTTTTKQLPRSGAMYSEITPISWHPTNLAWAISGLLAAAAFCYTRGETGDAYYIAHRSLGSIGSSQINILTDLFCGITREEIADRAYPNWQCQSMLRKILHTWQCDSCLEQYRVIDALHRKEHLPLKDIATTDCFHIRNEQAGRITLHFFARHPNYAEKVANAKAALRNYEVPSD